MTLLASSKCNNMAELIDYLLKLSHDVLTGTADSFVTVNDGAVSVRLECTKLTDGSEVYNLNIHV